MATSPSSKQQSGLSKYGDLKGRLIFLMLALVVYRIGAHVPVPGIDPDMLKQLFNQQQGGILGLFNMFSGGALSRFSVFALGIMPYISASIIFQMLSYVLPSLVIVLYKNNVWDSLCCHELTTIINSDRCYIIKNYCRTCVFAVETKLYIAEIQTINMTCPEAICRKNGVMRWFWVIPYVLRNIVRTWNPVACCCIPFNSRKIAGRISKPGNSPCILRDMSFTELVGHCNLSLLNCIFKSQASTISNIEILKSYISDLASGMSSDDYRETWIDINSFDISNIYICQCCVTTANSIAIRIKILI